MSSLCFKAKPSVRPLIRKLFFYSHASNVHFHKRNLHLASFSEWEFLEFGSGIFSENKKGVPCLYPQTVGVGGGLVVGPTEEAFIQGGQEFSHYQVEYAPTGECTALWLNWTVVVLELLLTVTGVSTACVVVIFRVKVSCISSVDGVVVQFYPWLKIHFPLF